MISGKRRVFSCVSLRSTSKVRVPLKVRNNICHTVPLTRWAEVNNWLRKCIIILSITYVVLVCLQRPLQSDRELLVDLMNGRLNFHLDASLSSFDSILWQWMHRRGFRYMWNSHRFVNVSRIVPDSGEAARSPSSVLRRPPCRGQSSRPGTAAWRRWAGTMTGRSCWIGLHFQVGCPFPPSPKSTPRSGGVPLTAAGKDEAAVTLTGLT